MKKSLISTTSFLFVLAPITLSISCSKKQIDTNKNIKLNNKKQNIYHEWTDKNMSYFNLKKQAFGNKDRILSDEFYNGLLVSSEFDRTKDVEFVVIANKKIYAEIVTNISPNEKVWNLMQKMNNIKIKGNNKSIMGVWISTFKIKKDDNTFSNWMHGENKNKNYGDYYPLYWINHNFASLGVSNWISSPGEIYEISYDVEL